jgi:hypothetical protein
MAREIRRKTRDPIATATLIDLIGRYAEGIQPETPAEGAVARSLTTIDPHRRIAQRLMHNFNSVPERNRLAVFGDFAPGRSRSAPPEIVANVFSQPGGALVFHDDVLGYLPVYPPAHSSRFCTQASTARIAREIV